MYSRNFLLKNARSAPYFVQIWQSYTLFRFWNRNFEIRLHRSLNLYLNSTENTLIFIWIIEKRPKLLNLYFAEICTTGGTDRAKNFFSSKIDHKNFNLKFFWASKWPNRPKKPQKSDDLRIFQKSTDLPQKEGGSRLHGPNQDNPNWLENRLKEMGF